MTWWSTIKAKAHEYVVRHYPLGSTKSCEENLANAQELICGAKFLRDGVEPDVCPPAFCITLKCNLFCRVPQKTWHLQLWLASFSNFCTQEPLRSLWVEVKYWVSSTTQTQHQKTKNELWFACVELDRSCTKGGTTPRGLMQQKGRGSSGLQRRRRMTRIGPGLCLSLGQRLALE